MTADDLSPEQEEHLIGEMLRERGGIDPGRLGPVIDLAALGLVNAAWRNTCVEDWHAGGRMHDGDMDAARNGSAGDPAAASAWATVSRITANSRGAGNNAPGVLQRLVS